MCSRLNFGLLDNQGNPWGVGIVFLCKPGTDNLNFLLCDIVTQNVTHKKQRSVDISNLRVILGFSRD